MLVKWLVIVKRINCRHNQKEYLKHLLCQHHKIQPLITHQEVQDASSSVPYVKINPEEQTFIPLDFFFFIPCFPFSFLSMLFALPYADALGLLFAVWQEHPLRLH